MNYQLAIKLFGGITIELNEEDVTASLTNEARLLLAYLAQNPHVHDKDMLAIWLWDNCSAKEAMANLETLIVNLPDSVAAYLVVTEQVITLNWGKGIWLDLAVFENTLQDLPDQPVTAAFLDPRHLEQALSLYQGEFLQGISMPDNHHITEWILTTQERLQHLVVKAYYHLTKYYLRQHDYQLGIDHARALLAIEPLREDVQGLLMRLLARDGQQEAALQQYKDYRQQLQEELGTEPTPEIEALYKRLQQTQQPIPYRVPHIKTAFVGRDEALLTIETRLDDPIYPVLTIVGPGGAGKTRLALEAASGQRGEYMDGIFFVSLAAESADSLPQVLAQALTLSLRHDSAPQTQLFAHLRQKEVLFILDGFDEVGDQGTLLVQTLVSQSPHVQFLITAQEPLHLQLEYVLKIEGLPYPSDEGEDAEAYEAVQLFQARAHELFPRFEFTAETKTAAGQICQLVQGLPLAVEIAAASLPLRSPAQIAANIQRHLDFLATRLFQTSQYHRCLWAVFEYVWATLPINERHIFSQLSVFPGSFDREATQMITGVTPSVLDILVAKSLLQRLSRDRYRLHEVVRQYAVEKLAADPISHEIAHSRYDTYLKNRQKE